MAAAWQEGHLRTQYHTSCLLLREFLEQRPDGIPKATSVTRAGATSKGKTQGKNSTAGNAAEERRPNASTMLHKESDTSIKHPVAPKEEVSPAAPCTH